MGQRRKESRKVKKEEKKAPPPVRKTVPPEFKVIIKHLYYIFSSGSVVTLNLNTDLEMRFQPKAKL